MEEDIKLPINSTPTDLPADSTSVGFPTDSTSVDLPAEATETKCELKTGESVLLLHDGSAKMPDGSIRSSLKGCKFEAGSSFRIEYGDDSNKMIAVKVSKPRQKIFPAVEVPSTPTPVYDDTIPIIQVDPKQSNKQVGNNVGIDPMIAGAIGIAAVSAIAVSSIVNSAKLRNLTKLKQLQTQNNKRKEEQSKCNSNSDSVKSLISMTEEMVDTSPINRIEISPNEQFISRVDENNNELKKLNKKIRDLEDKLTKVKNV